MRQLTAAQFRQSIKDLLGVEPTTELEPDLRIGGLAATGSSESALSPVGVERAEAATRDAVARAFADPKRLEALAGCAPSGPADEACARKFVGSFAARAWRRPLTPAEIDRWTTAIMTAARLLESAQSGFEYGAAGLLQSPNFVYRAELGEPDPRSPGRLRYTSYDMASRLSYFLTNTTPDAELLNAAAKNALLDDAGLRSEVTRLLASPGARLAVVNYARDRFTLDGVDSMAKDAKLFPQLSPSLRVAMREEVEELIWDSFQTKGDALAVFTARRPVSNPELARFYGASAPGAAATAGGPPEKAARAGLLGTAALLALTSAPTTTSPTARGLFIQEVLLCQPVSPPPADVSTNLPNPEPGMAVTKRQQLEAHRVQPACATCHAIIDPPGLALEGFDALGQFRATDSGLPIDTNGNLDGQPVAGPVQLGERLRAHPAASSCQVRLFYRYATGHLEAAGEEGLLKQIEARFGQSGHRLSELAMEIALSDGFRLAAPGN